MTFINRIRYITLNDRITAKHNLEINNRAQFNPLNSVVRINKTCDMKNVSFCPRGTLFSLCGSRDAHKREIIYIIYY
jgi:hypothetical protein